jgi:Copine
MICSRDDSLLLFEHQQKGPQQAYSVLLIFTNGPPVDTNKTLAAIRQAEADPLSVVIVGIGGADFSPLHQGLAASGVRRDMVRFVPYQNEGSSSYALTSAALDPIPSQLEAYFAGRGIRPNPPVAADEIVVEPYRPEPSPVYQVPVVGGSMTAAPSNNSYASVPVVAGSVYNPNAAAAPSSFASSGNSIPMGTVVSHPPTSSMTANSVPVATGVPIHAASSANPAPFNASLSTPVAAPAPHAGSGTAAGHSGTATNNSSSTNNNNKDDTMKGLGKKLMNSRIGKQAVGRLKGQAKAKINQFVKQKIGFGIL